MGSSAVMRMTAALCLCLAGAFVSGLLLQQHHGEAAAVAAVNEACGDGQTSGCEDVARSSWSSFAGVPLAAWGIAFYLALVVVLALALLGPAELRDPLGALALALLVAGLLVDLGLLGLQAFVIRAWCKLCLATYVLSALAAAALLPSWRGARAGGGIARRPEARLAIGGWLLAAAAIAAATLAWNAALAGRAAQRQAGLLGAPVAGAGAAASPAPAAQPSGGARAESAAPASLAGPPAGREQDPRYWQQRAQQLQATLDDPRKLEAYFAEKAQREYETAPAEAIDLSGSPARGPAGAPVQVVEYSDFLCPFCRNLAQALAQFVPQAGGRVAVYFKNYPLDNTCNAKLTSATHPGACHLALGAICAHRQGRFEAYHDKVFGTELRNPQPADVVRLAGEAGLDAQALSACLADQKAKAALAAEIAEANRLGVAATPTLYVNGRKLPRINDFVAVVDKEAQRKGFAPLAAR